MAKKNFDLLWQVYNYIKAHRKEWDQEVWARKPTNPEVTCGTAFCFAGHVVLATYPQAIPVWWDSHTVSGKLLADRVRLGNNRQYDISVLAQKKLGLTYTESLDLFAATNTLTRIRGLITKWERQDGPVRSS